MNIFRNNLIIYHSFSALIGIIYFYIFMYGYDYLFIPFIPLINKLGVYVESLLSSVILNITIGIIAGLIPALVMVLVSKLILAPKTKLFLINSTFSYAALSTWQILGEKLSKLHFDYMLNVSGKLFGGLAALWLIGSIYIIFSKKNKKDEATEN